MYDNYLSVINIAMKTKEGGVRTNGKEGEGVIWILYIRVQGILLLLSQHHIQPVFIYNHDFVLILFESIYFESTFTNCAYLRFRNSWLPSNVVSCIPWKTDKTFPAASKLAENKILDPRKGLRPGRNVLFLLLYYTIFNCYYDN